MRKLVLIALPVFIANISFAQQKLEIGIEGGISFDTYKINDPADNVRPAKEVSGMAGFCTRLNTRKNKIFYEVALLYKEYYEGLRMKQQSGWVTTNSDQAILIPLRVGYGIKLSKRFSLAPIVGIVPAIKTMIADSEGGYFEGSIGYTYKSRENESKTFYLLAQAGAGLEYVIRNTIRVSLNTNIYYGLMKTNVWDIYYNAGTVLGKPVMTGKGGFTNLSMGIKYIFQDRK